MPRLLRDTLISFRDLLATAGPLLLLTLALLAAAYLVLDPPPPKRVVLANRPGAERVRRIRQALRRRARALRH